MTRIQLLFEKIFAGIEILFACCLFDVKYEQWIEEGPPVTRHMYLGFLSSQVIYAVQLFILPLMFLVGGILLLANNRLGWLISLNVWLTITVIVICNLFSDFFEHLAIFQITTLFTCIVFIIDLAKKSYRIKYDIRKRDLGIVAALTILLSFVLHFAP